MLNKKRLLATALPAAIGLLLAAGLLAVLGGPAGRAAAAPLSAGLIRYVAPTGSDAANGCASLGAPCQSIQWALGQAQAGDEFWAASGVYTSAGGTVANITQTVTLQGGWNSAFSHNDPASQPTVLDGQGLQPVVVISPTALPVGAQMTPTIEGLVIVHGQGQSAECGTGVILPASCGGGIASLYADPLIVNNVISDNVGGNNSFGFGGGIYLFNAGAGALISSNVVYSNIANIGGTGLGGGILEHESLAPLQANHIQRNHDSLLGTGVGAGIQMFFSHANILDNDIRENVSSNRGGGINVNDNHGSLVISGNTILSNTAASQGGGLFLNGTLSALISGNSLLSNTAASQGGGLFINGTVSALISGNSFGYNRATSLSAGRGGGLRISSNNVVATIQSNEFYSNAAAWGGGSAIDLAAGGLVDGNYLHQNQNGLWGAALVLSGTTQPMTASNNLVVDNLGAGIEAISFTLSADIVNNTVVGSRSALSGAVGTSVVVYFDALPSLALTATVVNNIVLNSATCGIDAHNAPGLISHHNDVRGRGSDYCGSATSGGNLSVDPQFVNASGGDYHLSVTSPVINAGSNAEAPGTDKDGVSRPVGAAVDIGAYESLFGIRVFWPIVTR